LTITLTAVVLTAALLCLRPDDGDGDGDGDDADDGDKWSEVRSRDEKSSGGEKR
jgi:hypothetical protein